MTERAGEAEGSEVSMHCTCAFEDVPGSPCAVHPNGCEHGKMWNEPCDDCYRATWGWVGVRPECPLGCSAPQSTIESLANYEHLRRID
jgi:hypothetical protein